MLCLLMAMMSSANAWDRLSVFDEITQIVEADFYDPNLGGLDWPAVAAEYRSRVDNNMSRASFASLIKQMLLQLNASHTLYLTRDDPRWYQLVGIFVDHNEELQHALEPYLADGAPTFIGIGVMLTQRDDDYFVGGVLDGFPASTSGLQVGDRIVSADGQPFHPINSFLGRLGRPTDLLVERTPGNKLTIRVTPQLIDGRTMFETAMRASSRLIDEEGARVGYIRAWSYAGRRYSTYHKILVGELLNGTLRDAEGLVLDLRGGWGGADLTYLNIFVDDNIKASVIDRDGSTSEFSLGWDKPVVLLVDEGSGSGKELYAYGFRKLNKGLIVGERTAGAVLSAYLYGLADGSVLYLPLSDVVVEGQRLEGVGVEPDIHVPFDPIYTSGQDPQLERAIEEVRKQIR